jgi:hypothetical protein
MSIIRISMKYIFIFYLLDVINIYVLSYNFG